jgi:hypothetical protein
MRLLWIFALLPLAACRQSAPEPTVPLTGPDAGRRLYVAKCAKCHKFYDPSKYSDAGWSKWMAKMSKKAKLTPEQSSLISDYVDENLRHPDLQTPRRNPGT